MSTLTGNKIKDTYDGLLKTEDSTTGLPVSGKTRITDGLGNDSAVELGRDGEGISVIGDVVVSNNDEQRLIKSSVNGGAIALTGNSNEAANPERGLFLGRVDNTGAFTSAIDIPTDLEVEVNENMVFTQPDDGVKFDNGNHIIGDHSVDGLQIRTQQEEDIVFKTNGNNPRMNIKGDGKVGIGVTSPDANLHVSAGDTDDAVVIIESDEDNVGSENDNPHLELRQDGGGIRGKFGLEGSAGNTYSNSLSNATYLGTVYEQPLQFITGDTGNVQTAKMTIKQITGNVGIGETNPTSKFQIYDERSDDDSDDYTVVVKTSLPSPIPTPNPGTGGIKALFSDDNGANYDYGISMVPGTGSSDIMSKTALAFYSNSDLDTASASGLAMDMNTSRVKSHKNFEVDGNALISDGISIGKTTAPQRTLDVQGGAIISGNLKMSGATSKIGIGRSVGTVQHLKLDVEGDIRARGLIIGDADNIYQPNNRLLYISPSAGSAIGRYTQMDQYGQYNFSNISADAPTSSPKTLPCFSASGKILEDYFYYDIRIAPSWWGREDDDPTGSGDPTYYKEAVIYTTSSYQIFEVVEEITVIDNKPPTAGEPNSPARRGGFEGPDEDPWLSFKTSSGASLYDRQLAYIPLGTYRTEDKKWLYKIPVSTEFQPNQNYKANVQRSQTSLTLKARTLRVPVTRPNYDVFIRLKIKRFKVDNEFAQLDQTLS